MRVDVPSTAILGFFLALLLSLTVTATVQSQTVIASQDFDSPLNMNSQMIDPDGSTFMSAGDMFNVSDQTGAGNPTGLPFALADDSVDASCRGGAPFPSDNQGFITCSYPDGNFFGVVDLDNPDNTTGMGTVDWAFQIDNLTDLVVSIDMAAMGDFEASGDIFNFSYSFDNINFTPLFTSSVNEAASQTYTLEDGDMFTLDDPLIMSGTLLNENFQTLAAALTGTGAVLYLHFEATNDGGSEAFAFDNIVITSGAVLCPTVAQVFLNEFHYDNDGGDAGEFVEVAVANSFSGNLSDVVLTLYNGSNGSSYGTHDLSTFTAGTDDGTFTYYSKEISGIQNGAPDGLALSCNGLAFQFLSYESNPFMAVGGDADGQTSTDIGTSEPSTAPLGSSIQLINGVWTYTLGFNTQGEPNAAMAVECPGAGEAFINEFHYDNAGTDVNEFVEIAIANTYDGAVDAITLTLYNASNGAAYDSYTLADTDFIEGDDDGTFTYYSIVLPSNGIQNGAPDGLALSCDGDLIEFLSYEGVFTAIDGPAVDIESTDVGVAESGDTPEEGSLQLINGVWVATCQNTIGAANENIPCCDITFDEFIIVDESCVGEGDGSITVMASCLTCDGILYSFDGGETFSTENTASGLAEDCYTVMIQAVGVDDCEVSRVLIVENDNPTVIPQIEELSFVREAMLELAGAEIVAYIPDNNTAAVTSGDGLQLVDLSDPSAPGLIMTIAPTSLGFSNDEVSSTAYSNGIIAAAVPNDNTQMPGDILFFDVDGNFLNSVTVGALPDMVKFTPDGTKLLVANEGEPSSDYTIDPEGSISIIDLSGGAGSATVMTADFTAFNGTEAAIEADGGRIFGPGATVAQDLEPEYITITDDGVTAFVTCQENNLIAVVDIASATVTSLFGLGLKAYCEPGNDLDASNRDDGINIKNWPAVGMYQPDGIECYTANGQMYIVSANEGDARDYDGFSEEARGDDLDLDPAAYPDAGDLQLDENLGRLTVTTTEGDLDGDGDYDQITSFGARSFSIWNATTGDLVFDSGSDLGNISALITPTFFNANDGDEAAFDERSDDKGIEPEGIAIKEIGGSVYAFVIFERAAGGFAVYNITDPVAPYFVTYVPGADVGDIAPESIVVVDPNNNPTDGFLVLLASEESGTLSTFSVTDNKETGIIPVTILTNGGSGVYTAYSASITGGTAASEVNLYDGDTANPILDATQVTEPGTVILETQVTDENGCVTTVMETIFVVPALARDIAISDPCSCLDNATVLDFDNNTGGDDGQFAEQVAITGIDGTALPAGLDFRVVSITGGTDANNVPMVGTQSDGTPFAGEEPLTYDPTTGYYTIDFVFVENQGYTITIEQFVVGNATGGTFTISNNCAYPNPVFDPILDAIYCNFEEATTLGASDLENLGADAISFTINGQAATEFDPVALGAGMHTIVLTYDGAADTNGGISPDGGTTAAFPGCTQTAQVVVEVGSLDVGCVADLNVTLGEACSTVITPQMVLTGSFACADEIIVTVDGGNTAVISGCGAHTYSVDVFVAGEIVYTCWGNLFAEDKTNPVVTCPANKSTVTQDYAAHQASGNLNAADATLNFNNYSCLNQGFLADGVHNYDVVTFTTPDFAIPVDVYTILMETAWGDGSMFLFQGGFDPTAPCENLIGSSDDAFVPGGNPFDPALRLSLPLLPNTTYTLVLTNWLTTQFGNWTVSIYSDNNTGVSGPEFTPVNITDTRDLVCDDINFIRFQTPQSWIASADGTLNFTATRNTFFGGSTAALNAFIAKVNLTGFPVVSDNCGPVKVTLSDAVSSAGDCGDVTLTRTFTVSDRYDGACVGAPRVVACTQTITFRKPTIGDLVFPPFVAPLECDENFAVDANGNPHPSASGYPWLRTAFGFYDLDQIYCNIGASYSDEPRITVCEGTYKLRREWNIIDWCNPGGSGTLQQLIKVFDATGPVISGIPNVINVSTSPFSCLANVAIPCPTLTDGNGCSSVAGTTYTVLAFGESFFAGGDLCDGDVVSAPIGEHTLIICAEDACGNETCEEYTVVVTDDIEPTASCNDDINVSIGGGDVANGIEGIARLFAADVDEGSNDNCGEVTLEVRRNYWRNNTCDASASRWSPWGDFVDFYCCDIDNEITIELRVTDEAGNTNICWQVVTPEDKLNPFCYAPAPVTLTCSDLPLAFPGDIATAYDEDFAATSTMMSAIFGGATGTDNCAVDTIVERTPNLQVNDCGWGTITRRFEAWQLRPEGDANGNGAIDINEVFRSTNSCSQLITITEVHDFTIDFPEDADADCGDPDVPTIITTAVGCDVLSVNIGEPVIFSATGDECYKFSITYDVINWCVWDGEYEGLVLPRMTEDDGEALPVDRAVEGNERPVVRVVSGFGPVDNNCDNEVDPQPGIQYSVVIDRRHNDRDGDSDIADVIYDNIPGNTPGCIPADQFGRRNYGRYIYTQFVKVYDSTAPVVAVGEYGGPTANCPNLLPGQFGDDDGNCEEAVSIPFSVSDECELFDGAGNLVVSIVSAELDAFAVDANGDGDIKSNEFVADLNVLGNITDNGDGTYVFAGTFPIITSAMGDNIYHAVRVLFEDGCGNQTSETIVFDVIDCKGPAPVCINGLTVTLMPQEEGGCAMAIWASDFEGSPISDCTGQGPELFGGLPRVTKYAIYRAADVEADPNFVPSPDDTGLVLTQDDEATTVVYVYAFDEDGNYDYCETYVLVQQHVDCGVGGTGTIQGVIATENNETVEAVEVSVNGNVATMTTNADGTFSFVLPAGGDYSVAPYLNANFLNGVSTFDLVLMSKHILGVQPLNSPYKYIAADVNNSETITTLDMIQLRKLILNIDTEFANNTSWRFVNADFVFPVANNPWFTEFPEVANVNNLPEAVLTADFVGVKIGDVNGSAQANALAGDDRTLNGQFNFEVENVSVKAGNVYTVAFRGADMASVEGFQGTLNLNGAELVDIEYGVATAENFGMRYAAEGQITASWNGKATSEDVLFSLVIRPTVDAELSDVINVSSRYTAAEAYGNGNTMNVGVNFSNGAVAVAGFEVYQNTPNPFAATTLIGFNLPADAEATVTISDASGRVLTVVRGDYAAGYNTINLTKEMIQGATGVLTYTVTAGEFTATKKMIAVK
ncbi:choice-of-anchor I family protein [Lewinella sp. LCG006]|uniref:choice-of-anchor I family protein n=1 Tax=Lewinella sp. LCG006 TaxID=3231911 RepID=UPI003461752D